MELAAQVIPRLYVGSYGEAADLTFLEKHNIGTVITCGNCEADWCQYCSIPFSTKAHNSTNCYVRRSSELNAVPHFSTPEDEIPSRTLHDCHIDFVCMADKQQHEIHHQIIPILDDGQTNILQYIDDTIRLVDRRLEAEYRSILIHCWAGESRSVALCVAYIMHQKNCSFDSAYSMLFRVYPRAQINASFTSQLRLYEATLAGKVGLSKVLSLYQANKTSQFFFDSADTFTFLQRLLKTNGYQELHYLCKRCRSILFDNSNILNHEEDGKISKMKSFKCVRKRWIEINHQHVSPLNCSSFFIEPMKWMSPLREQSGRIVCSNVKCRYKLGYWSWCGLRCSCGIWEAPGFQIHKSKIDCISIPFSEGWFNKPLPMF